MEELTMTRGNEALVMTMLEAAYADDAVRKGLMEDPSGMMKSAGMMIPEGTEAAFDKFFKQQTKTMMAGLTGAKSATLLPASMPSSGCVACTIGAWTVAALIVALGAGMAATITTASSVAIALASWAGVGVGAAVAFIKSLTISAGTAVATIAKAMCKWIGACP